MRNLIEKSVQIRCSWRDLSGASLDGSDLVILNCRRDHPQAVDEASTLLVPVHHGPQTDSRERKFSELNASTFLNWPPKLVPLLIC
jgi:hypothetical protein